MVTSEYGLAQMLTGPTGVLGEGDECVDADEQLRACDSEFEFSRIEEEDVLKLLCSLDPKRCRSGQAMRQTVLNCCTRNQPYSDILV